jgi:hypothetical protein
VNPKVENLFLDCGARNEKILNRGITRGPVVTYRDGFDELAYDTLIAGFRQPDSGFMIAEVARLLKENKKKLPMVYIS